MDMGTYAHPLAIKAWKISDDEKSHIVWCDHGLQARRIGAERLDLSFEDVECERYPKLDGFTGDLLQWMLEDGWYFECTRCYIHTGLGYPGFMQTEHGDIFCSEACATKYRAQETEKARLKQEHQRFAEVKFLGFDPVVTHVNSDGSAFVHLNPPIHSSEHCLTQYIDRAELGAL